MTNAVLAPASSSLSEPARLANTFVAPEKTFLDIRRSAMWWLPFVVTALVSLFFAHTVLTRVGVPALIDGLLKANTALESRVAGASPGDAARIRASMATQFRMMYIAPVFSLLAGLLAAAVLMAVANFDFAGRSTYRQMLAVWFYGTLPFALTAVLATVLIYAGVGTENFNIRNVVGTNIGYYLQGTASPAWLVTLLSSIDLFAVWSALLLTCGVTTVAHIKRSAAAAVVFGSWAIYVLAQTGIAAIMG